MKNNWVFWLTFRLQNLFLSPDLLSRGYYRGFL